MFQKKCKTRMDPVVDAVAITEAVSRGDWEGLVKLMTHYAFCMEHNLELVSAIACFANELARVIADDRGMTGEEVLQHIALRLAMQGDEHP